jgi:AbrB family looped-hinge helix DNA binding protein
MENIRKKNSEVEEDEDKKEKESKEKNHEKVIVKGYMRPDGTSYYVVIPKEIRQLFNLKGGEYFLIKAKPSEREIKLKIAEFVEEGQP